MAIDLVSYIYINIRITHLADEFFCVSLCRHHNPSPNTITSIKLPSKAKRKKHKSEYDYKKNEQHEEINKSDFGYDDIRCTDKSCRCSENDETVQ